MIITSNNPHRICDWREDECPPATKKWKQVVDDAAVKISNRITCLIDHWQKDNKVLDVIDQEIIRVFSTEFGLLESQVNDIECKLFVNGLPVIEEVEGSLK